MPLCKRQKCSALITRIDLCTPNKPNSVLQSSRKLQTVQRSNVGRVRAGPYFSYKIECSPRIPYWFDALETLMNTYIPQKLRDWSVLFIKTKVQTGHAPRWVLICRYAAPRFLLLGATLLRHATNGLALWRYANVENYAIISRRLLSCTFLFNLQT